MKNLKKIVSSLLVLTMLLVNIPLVYADTTGPALTADQVNAAAGVSVDVPITLTGNTGIAGAMISVSYDSALTLTGVRAGEGLGSLNFTRSGSLSANPVRLLWDGTEEDISDGEIAVLTFTAPAAAGTYSVEVSYESGDILNGSLVAVDPAVTDGAVIVGDAPAYSKTLSLENLSYSFANSYSAFGYSSDYKIPLKCYQMIFGKTTLASYYYSEQSTWGGSCFGFSCTASLMHDAASGISETNFNSSASKISDLGVDDGNSTDSSFTMPGDSTDYMSVREFMESMQIAQKTPDVSAEKKKNRVYTSDIQNGTANLNALVAGVTAELDAGNPVIMAVAQDGSGHAILAYQIADVSNTETDLYIYDNNYPLQERRLIFTKDSAGDYTAWSYDMGSYGTWGTECNNSNISYFTYATIKSIWTSRGNLKNSVNTMQLNSDNVSIYNDSDKLVAYVEDGQLITIDDRISLVETGMDEIADEDQDMQLTLPIGVYTLKNKDNSIDQLEVTMLDTELGITVETTSDTVRLAVDDSDHLNAAYIDARAGDIYTVTMNSSFVGDDDDVVLSGTGTGDTMEISQINGQYNLSHCNVDSFTIAGQEQINYHVITASAGDGGSISPDGDSTVPKGDSLTCTITPDAGYEIADVKVDGMSVGALSSYTFTNVKARHNIIATFKRPGLEIVKQPDGGEATIGQTKTISFEAVNAKSYQWYYSKDGGESWNKLYWTGAKTNTLSVEYKASRVAFQYKCLVKGTDGTTVFTNPTTITQGTAPAVNITQQPQTVCANIGETVSLSITADNVISYQWYYSKDDGTTWTKLYWDGATTDTLTFEVKKARYSYVFYCKLIDGNGKSYYSSRCYLRQPLSLTKQPQSVTAAIGDTVNLTVSAVGAASYQWYYSSDNGSSWKKLSWTGAKSDTLTVDVTQTRCSYVYHCVLTGYDGTEVTTNTVRVTAAN